MKARKKYCPACNDYTIQTARPYNPNSDYSIDLWICSKCYEFVE